MSSIPGYFGSITLHSKRISSWQLLSKAYLF